MKTMIPRKIKEPKFNRTLTVSGSATRGTAYFILPDGRTVSSAGTYSVPNGSVITFYQKGYTSTTKVTVVVNGTTKSSGTGTNLRTYKHTVTANATISISAGVQTNTITVTEE